MHSATDGARRALGFILLAAATAALTALPAPAKPPAAATRRVACSRRSHCRGPKLRGRRFAVLSDAASGVSIAAARHRWGDYDKIYLVITNLGTRLLDFKASQVAVSGRHSGWQAPVNLTILNHQRGGGGGLYFGDDPGSILPGPDAAGQPVPTSPEARRVLDQQPISQADVKLENARLKKLAAQLRPALGRRLFSGLIQPHVVLAGYLFFPRRRHNHWRRLRVELGGVDFLLPLR